MTESKAEQELREQIAETLPCFRDKFDRMPCPYDGECGKCGDTREAVDHLVIILKETGYKSPGELDAWARANGYVKLADIDDPIEIEFDWRERTTETKELNV